LSRKRQSFGASVRGPLHKRNRELNQDAWLRSSGVFGSLIVVCDGLGSKSKSRLGAKAACHAVHEAAIRWAKVDGAPLSYLSKLVNINWALRIHPVKPSDAATTCLLALALANGDWVVGGIGDGLVLTMTGDKLRRISGDKQASFGDETDCLGGTKRSDSWHLERLEPTSMSRMAILATDGIADDLHPDKLDGFCEWIVDEFLGLPPTRRWRLLASELRAWPTPRHLDDKTLAVLFAGENSRGTWSE
jgi:hypothetical protein